MFEGIYYDGQSSKGHKCNVLLATEGFEITYRDINKQNTQVFWEVAKIERNEFNDYNKRCSFKYGEFPQQTLEVDSSEFFHKIQEVYSTSAFTKSNYRFILSGGWSRLLVASVLAFALLVGSYSIAMPWMADRMAMNFPASYERELGRSISAKVNAESNFLLQEEETKLVQQFFDRLGFARDYPYPVEVRVSSMGQKNAFALPGGYIVLSVELLSEFESKEELAGVLAHEYSHIELKHSLRSMFRSLSGYIFISSMLGDVSGVSAALLQGANSLNDLHHSRGFEKDADLSGLQMMIEANVSPEGMLKVIEKLKDEYGKQDSEIPEFLKTHPDFPGRIDYLQKQIQYSQSVLTKKSDPVLDDLWRQIENSPSHNSRK